MKTLKEIRVERIIEKLLQLMRVEACGMSQMVDAVKEGLVQPKRAIKSFKNRASRFICLSNRYDKLVKAYNFKDNESSRYYNSLHQDFDEMVVFFS